MFSAKASVQTTAQRHGSPCYRRDWPEWMFLITVDLCLLFRLFSIVSYPIHLVTVLTYSYMTSQHHCFFFFVLWKSFNQLKIFIVVQFLYSVMLIIALTKNNFIYLFLAVLGPHCFVRSFSSCAEWASHCGGFACC